MTATMFRPGTEVLITDQPGPVSAPVATDAWFATGVTTYGPSDRAQLVLSMVEYASWFGPRDPASVLYDAVETFFREGGSRCYVSRVAPAGGGASSATLNDASAASSLHVSAASNGAWGNDVSIVVAAAGSGFTISVVYDGETVEESPTLADVGDAVDWSTDSSRFVTISQTGANDPAAGTFPLSGGANGTYDDAAWAAALDNFVESLGPGQVSAPGRTDPDAHADVLAHALATNRVALLDGEDTANVATHEAAVVAARTSGDEDHQGGYWAAWAVVPGLAANTTRQVPWSAIQAGIYARNEGSGVSPAQPAAGQTYGRSRAAIGLTQPTYSAAERNALTLAGVNTARADLGLIESYGSRTIVDPATTPEWRELAQVRLLMAITARAEAIAEAHLFAVLDGHRHEISAFGGELRAMLIPYVADGSLYGDTPQEAFRVDVGPAVNTEATIADGQLRAVIGVRCSHMAEYVQINIVKVPTTLAV